MNTRYLTLIAMVAMALASVSCKKGKPEQQKPEPELDVAMPIVDSVTLHRTLPGYISAQDQVDVVARVSGKILSQNYEDGAYVTQGQVLFTIESTKYKDAVQQAQAQLASAQTQYEYYKKQYEAMQKALKSDAVSQMEVNQSKSNLDQAAASISNAKAALETAQTNLGYCVVRAPVSGHITEATLSVGNFVDGSVQAVKLATIYEDSKVDAVFSLESTQYELLMQSLGTSGKLEHVPLNFNAPMSQQYTADLYYSSPAVDKSTGTMLLKGAIPNPKNELKDGMYVSVNLPYGFEPTAILINDASIGTDQLGKYVYVVNDSNKVVYTPIEVGELYRDSLRIVNKGLNPGDRYVTKALLTVRNGEKVKPRLINN